MKITLPQFDLKYDKIVEPIEHYIELLSAHLIWRFVAYVDCHPSDDDSLGVVKEGQLYSFHYLIPKTAIGMSSSFDNENDVWIITISSSCIEDINLKFESEYKMRKVEISLMKWIINN